MKEHVCSNYCELSKKVAERIIEQLRTKPKSLITIAGGETPLGVLKYLSEHLVSEDVDYSQVKFISLDEWVGLDSNTYGSCRQTLNDGLFNNINLTSDQIIFFDGNAENLTLECEKVDKIICDHEAIDLIVLGIGMNGHLGFNEPNIVTTNASIVKLSDVTKNVMNKYFNESMELTHGITLGYNQILQSKKIILMASGSNKRSIMDEMKRVKVSYSLPASLLKYNDALEIYIDEEANIENGKDQS